MRRKLVNHARTGGFFVEAAGLLIGAILVLGSSRFLAVSVRKKCFFMLRRMVCRSVLRLNPVVCERERRRRSRQHLTVISLKSGPVFIEVRACRVEDIDQRTGAEAVVPELVTRQLFPQLDFYADAPAKHLRRAPLTGLPEIATVPIMLVQVSHAVCEAFCKDAEYTDREAAAGLNLDRPKDSRTAENPRTPGTIRCLNAAIAGVEKLVASSDPIDRLRILAHSLEQ